jgi:lipopolysaccharide transport system ATP-binding protein
MFIDAGLARLNPKYRQFFERTVVAFQVVEHGGGHSARGDYAGTMTGVVRPPIQWETQSDFQ